MAFSLKLELEKKGLVLAVEQFQQFETYYAMLVDWNNRMNLTAITAYDEVMEKHFYDSISPAFYHDFSSEHELIDIGAGAGFPSLPLKIMYPHLKVTIVDSLNKRITFLQELVRSLGLTDVSLIHGRAEELAQQAQHREKYPLVIARAVARLPVLAELCLPFARVGGSFIALKGSSGENEIIEANKALQILGGEVAKMEHMQLPNEEAQRTLIWLNKTKRTPKQYPRKAGTPNKVPL